jgi:hypothetical protein
MLERVGEKAGTNATTGGEGVRHCGASRRRDTGLFADVMSYNMLESRRVRRGEGERHCGATVGAAAAPRGNGL